MGRSFSSELVLALRVLGVVMLVLTSSRVRFADSDDDDDGTGTGAGADRGARAGLGAGCIDFDCAFSVGGLCTVHPNRRRPLSGLIYRIVCSCFEFRVSNTLAWRVSSKWRRTRAYARAGGRMGDVFFRLGSGRGAAVRSGLVHAYVRDTGSTRPTAG